MSVKVSIVMPVLNGMPYFKDAIESVMRQSMADIEVIVVDGGSSDGTVEWVEKCVLNDSRIKLLHADKRSMGYQYNLGMQQSQGEYIGFCESDDLLEVDAIEYLYNLAEESGKPDSVKSVFKIFIEKNGGFAMDYSVLPRNCLKFYNKIITAKELPAIFFRDVNMWNGIYKREFIEQNKIALNETKGAAFQDTGFVLQVHALAGSSIYGNKVVYKYRKDNEGSSVYKSTTGEFALNEMIYMLKFLASDNVCKDKWLKEILDRVFGLFGNSYGKDLYWNTTESYKQEVLEAQAYVRNYYSQLTDYQKSVVNENRLMFAFMESLEIFQVIVKNNYVDKIRAMRNFWECCRTKNNVVIFGCGENGQCIVACFIKNAFCGKIVFCDNKTKDGMKVVGIDVFSVEEAVKKNGDATYIISNIKYYHGMREQLNSLGINNKQIICAPTFGPYFAFETDVCYI